MIQVSKWAASAFLISRILVGVLIVCTKQLYGAGMGMIRPAECCGEPPAGAREGWGAETGCTAPGGAR